MKVETVIEKYIGVREKRALLKREYELQDAKLQAAANKMEVWFLNKMKEENVDAYKTSSGTAYISQKIQASCADWPNFWTFCAENNCVQLLEKRVAVGAIKEYEETHGELPPFINKMVERIVKVRRS